MKHIWVFVTIQFQISTNAVQSSVRNWNIQLKFKLIHIIEMKIFRTVRKYYAILGIDSSNQSPQKHHFSKREICGLFSLGCLIISQFAYILCVASSFMGYIEAICALSVTTILLGSCATIIIKKIVLFELYDRIEKLIDTSKATCIWNS